MSNPSSESVYALKNPWEKEVHKIWLASTLRLTRNFANFLFPHKLTLEQKEQIVYLAYKGLSESKYLEAPVLFSSNKITPIEKEYLLEHFLISNGFHHAHKGEGFVIDNSSDFLGTININNHLQFTILDTSQEIEKALNRLIKIESALGETVHYAYNNRFGFLTANPQNAGTALRVTLYLHIPAVIHSGELTELLEREKEEEIKASGLQGNITEMIGDILVTSNICTIGLTEEYILTAMRMWATRTIIAEMNLRKKLMSDDNEKIKNKVTRALGLLTHSYQLETIEAMNALSLVKLGIDIGWILPPEGVNITKLLFDTRRAHLLNALGTNTPITELPKKRAEYLHTIAKSLNLTI
jgi:protein arginine kinase